MQTIARWKLALIALALCLTFATTVTRAAISIHSNGLWPETWPPELEPYRKGSWTFNPIDYDCDGTLYRISAKDTEDFDRLWSGLLKLLDRGSEVTLRSARLEDWPETTLHPGQPVVQIYAPPLNGVGGYPPMLDESNRPVSSERVELWYRLQRNEPLTPQESDLLNMSKDDMLRALDVDAMRTNNGRWVRVGPPWPDDLRNEAGELPDLVHFEDIDGTVRWVAGPYPGWSHGTKCRIDLELVVDGSLVDVDRLEIPAFVRVIDQRLSPIGADGAATGLLD